PPGQMDVAFPVGDKSFTLPPGRSSRFYEGSPAVPGRIVGLGGHMHDYGRVIEFADVTTGELIYRAAPRVDSTGHIESIPIAMLYGLTRLGVHIVPEHRYRIAVSYDNPTGVPIPDGGMGVVGGLFVPDHGVTWPAADPGDSLYQQDYRHYMRLEEGGGHHMMSMPMKMTAHEHPSHARRLARRLTAQALEVVARERPVLERLAGRYRLGVVSNFTGNLRPCLEELGLARLFAVLSDSALVGWSKPDPRIFGHALAALQVAPQRAWMVGDNFEADIRGAAGVGLRTCWLAPSERTAPPGGERVVTARIGRLPEVERVLE